MCIIFRKPCGKELPELWLRNAWATNPHGFGLMWSNGNSLQLDKTLSYKTGLDMLAELKDVEVYVHLRKRTKGTIDLESAHPFIINDDIGLMHNGTIPELGNDDDSDSRQLAELLETFTTNDLFEDKGLPSLLNKLLINNRAVFMDSKGNVKLFGKWFIIGSENNTSDNQFLASNLYAWTAYAAKNVYPRPVQF